MGSHGGDWEKDTNKPIIKGVVMLGFCLCWDLGWGELHKYSYSGANSHDGSVVFSVSSRF